MFDKQSDYALNKADRDAIVCKSVTGNHIRLTREDFASEEEFLTWKAWSDEDFHVEERENHTYEDNTVQMGSISETEIATPSAEVELEHRIDKRRRLRYNAETVASIRHILTERQFRRLWMYCVEGMTQQQIADLEGVGQPRIFASLIAAEKRIKKFSSGAEK